MADRTPARPLVQTWVEVTRLDGRTQLEARWVEDRADRPARPASAA